MGRIFLITLILMALAACTPKTDMSNPASVYCEQNGYRLEIRTADDGSQNGICVFPDGSSCDEWVYYRGECGPAAQENPTPALTTEATIEGIDGGSGGYMPPGATEEIIDWWGMIKSTEPGAQFDDCFERQDLGQSIYFGIDSTDPEVSSRIEALRDSGRIVHLYGTLFSNVPDCNGSQILVEHIEVDE